MLGLSSAAVEVVLKDSDNIFKQISPLPLLFSLGKGRLPKVNKAKIYLITDHETHRFKFNRKFYSSLKGPHRRKVQFLVKLTGRGGLMSKESNRFLYKFFCQNYVELEYLKNQRIKEIKVVDLPKTMTVDCNK